MTFKINLDRLAHLSQYSNAVLSPDQDINIGHYQIGARKYSPLNWSIDDHERKACEIWCEQQLEQLKNTESTAVMSFLIKEHNA